MTISELKYLNAINDLINENKVIKQVDIAKKLNVSKVSVYNGVERLAKYGYIKKDNNKIDITDKGKQMLEDYFFIIGFVSGHLHDKCNIGTDLALIDAMEAVCVLSDLTRINITAYLKSIKNKGVKNDR